MEFLMGRSLLNTLYNLGIRDQYAGRGQQRNGLKSQQPGDRADRDIAQLAYMSGAGNHHDPG
jgi:hypothetical protein